MKNIVLLICFQLYIIQTFSQNIDSIRVDKLYMGSFDKIMKDIQKQHKVKMTYDLVRVQSITINERPMKLPLRTFLMYVCKENKLKFYVDNNGVINIIDRFDNPQAINFENKRYQGEPEKLNFTLTGKVIDKLSGESLPFVNILVSGTTKGTTTNGDGNFTFTNVPADTNTIIFSYIGYSALYLSLNPKLSVTEVTVEMEPVSQQIKEVMITDERQEMASMNNKVSMIRLSPGKLASLPSLGERDLFRSFQLLPGISAANENTSGLYVRGGTPDQSLVLYDGFPVYNVDHLFGFFSAFNANAIKDVQLYKGSFDAKYGGRLSSVVEILGKEGNKKAFNTGFEAGFLSFNVFAEAPVTKTISAIVAFRRSWRTPLYNKIFNQFNKTSNSGQEQHGPPGGGMSNFENEVISYFYDLNSKISYNPSSKDVLTLSFYTGADKLNNSIVPPAPPGMSGSGRKMSMGITDLTHWGNTGTSLKWSRQWTQDWYENTIFSFSNYFNERDHTMSGTMTDNEGNEQTMKRGMLESNNLTDLTAKTNLEYKLTQWDQLEFGGAYTFNEIKYNYSFDDTSSLISTTNPGFLLTGFMQNKVKLFGGKWNTTTGMRYNYYSETQKGYVEPRLNTVYDMTTNFKIKGSLGMYYQFAKRVVREDIMQGSREFWILSDGKQVPVSNSFQAVLGGSYETRGFLFDVEGYYKNLNGLSEYSMRLRPPDQKKTEDQPFFTGSGFARGIDFMIQKKVGKYTGWIGYTLGEVKHKFPRYGDFYFSASNDVTHEVKLVQCFKWRQFDFSAVWIYATGRPYTAPEGAYQITLLDGTTHDYINVSTKNGSRLPSYHRFDLSATYNFILGEESPCSLSFSIFNLYNHKNIWYKNYEVADGQIVESNVYNLGFSPNLTLTFKLR